MRSYRYMALALGFVVTSSVGVSAQESAAKTSSPPKPPTQAQQALLNTVISQNRQAIENAAASGQKLVAGGSLGAPGKQVVSGWNLAHATNCGWYNDGINEWFFVYPAEGGIVYALNDLYVSQGLQISCGDGNYFAWYVTNTSTGAYNETFSYTFK